MDCENKTDSGILLIGIANEEWLEQQSFGNFRTWHVILIFFSGFLSFVICLCCCIRFRIPRTKQEIEADYVRKKITRKFKKQLRLINNSEMDEMDLKKALDRIRAEFKNDTESLALSEGSIGGDRPVSPTEHSSFTKPTALGIDIEQLIEHRNSGVGPKLSRMVGSFKLRKPRRSLVGQEAI